MSSIDIHTIKVRQRHRRDLGDIAGLAESIQTVGLLHPIVIKPDRKLIAGERRLAACKLLGWKRVAVKIVDLDQIVRGEHAENAHRKDFAPSEVASIMRALEPIEKAAARKRMLAGKPSAKFAEGRTRDKIARFAGISGYHLDKIKAVVEAAEREPERFATLQADMDRTGRVNGPYKRLKVAIQADAIKREPPPLPGNGPYRVIVADPPWPYDKRHPDPPINRAVHPYPTISLAQIGALRVGSIAHADCVLWLWTTNYHMREAFDALAAWGFEQRTILTWAKDRMGCGDWLRGQTEHCLLAVRGKPVVTLTKQSTLLHGPARAHSQKPEQFYQFVEGLCPAPRYCDLFSRYRHSDRWDCHGDGTWKATAPVKSAGPPRLAALKPPRSLRLSS
jgi:N6-adenosine-specific RNA methylase IME4/ParB-like chromosome segregation protein Spo0J